MKTLGAAILLCVLMRFSTILTDVAEEQHPLVAQFVIGLDQYYPDANWITNELIQMPLKEFGESWSYLVSLLKNRATRWQYLYDDPTALQEDEEDACAFVEQFHIMHQKLLRIAVDASAGEFRLFCEPFAPWTRQIIASDGKELVTLHAYWRAAQTPAFYDFYALYFKYLSFVFIEIVKKADQLHDKKLLDDAQDLYRELDTIYFDYVFEGPYEEEYDRERQRYEKLLNLVLEEYDKKVTV